MKFNVKIVRLGKYLDKYNILPRESKNISQRDADEITQIFNSMELLKRYPIYLTDNITILKSQKPYQFMITSFDNTTNNRNAVLGNSTVQEIYSIRLRYTEASDTYTLSFEEI